MKTRFDLDLLEFKSWKNKDLLIQRKLPDDIWKQLIWQILPISKQNTNGSRSSLVTLILMKLSSEYFFIYMVLMISLNFRREAAKLISNQDGLPEFEEAPAYQPPQQPTQKSSQSNWHRPTSISHDRKLCCNRFFKLINIVWYYF